jgi:flagellar protein FlaD
MKYDKDEFLKDVDLRKELSTLVDHNIIPSRIAEKLEKKLKAKNIKISKEQLHAIVSKIRKVVDNYFKSSQKEEQNRKNLGQFISGKTNANMQELVESIEELNKRLMKIESDKSINSNNFIQEDTHNPEKMIVHNKKWEIDPLTEIPNDPENIIILIKWLQHLVDKCGHSNLSKILEYYVDIGWISEDIKINLIEYSNGLTEECKKGETTGKKISNLPSQDHIQSLLFIQKLKGQKIDKHFLDRIDDNISRITKKLDNTYQLK